MDFNGNTPDQNNVNNNQYNPNGQYVPNNQYTQYNPSAQFNQDYNALAYQQQMAQDDKKANTLCWISVLCSIVGMVLMSTYGELELPDFIVSKLPAFVVDIMDDIQSYASMFLFTIGGLAHSAGFVLMIIARVKYPKNTFAKVLMWIYIIGIILSVIATILVIASCLYCASQCRGF